MQCVAEPHSERVGSRLPQVIAYTVPIWTWGAIYYHS